MWAPVAGWLRPFCILAASGLIAVAVSLVIPLGAASAEQRFVGRIVFSASLDGRESDLYALRLGTNQPRRLTRAPGDERFPAWSPDGRWIAYSATTRKGATSVIRINSDGTNPRVLFKRPAVENISIEDMTWSPDGRKIAFAVSGSSGSIVWLLSVGGGAKPLRTTFLTHPTWSPDGRHLAFGGLGGIFIANADGTRLRKVPRTTGRDAYPLWSPGGRSIAIRTMNRNWRRHEVDSLQMITSAGVRRLILRRPAIVPLAWSPDGNAILYAESSGQFQAGMLASRRAYPIDTTLPGTQTASWHR